jgi:hypothetical protein
MYFFYTSLVLRHFNACIATQNFINLNIFAVNNTFFGQCIKCLDNPFITGT